MEIEQAGGIAIVGDRLVVRRTARGDWVLPKGRVEAGETPEATARREMREETGLETVVVDRAGEVRFRQGDQWRHVHFFITRVVGYNPSWLSHYGRDTFLVDANEAWRVLTFENLRQLWEQAKKAALKSVEG